MAKDIPLPPRRPDDMSSDTDTSTTDTGGGFYPQSNIPVDPDYASRLEAGYKTPKKKTPIKKAKGGMVRGCGIASKGHGKGKMC